MQLCMHMYRQGYDYAPVVDPETNSLVAILGYHDLGMCAPTDHSLTLTAAAPKCTSSRSARCNFPYFSRPP